MKNVVSKLRLPSSKDEFRRDFDRLAFAAAFILSVCGTITTCGGLAALTDFCWDNQPTGLAMGFDLNADPPKSAFSAQVMSIQKAVVTGADGHFQCDKFFRFDWFLWTLQVTFLIIVGISWYRATLRKYGAALWSLGATVTAWHLFKINYIIDMDQWTVGTLHLCGLMTAGGLMITCTGNYLMFFAGCAYGLKQQGAARQGATGTNSDTEKGSFSDNNGMV